MIDLMELADRMQKAGLMNKPFFDCTKTEILKIVDAVFSSIGDDVPVKGWAKPYIDDAGRLVVPFDVHPEYRWWTSSGKSIWEILVELDAPFDVARKYVCKGGMGSTLTEQDWIRQTLPF